VLSINKASRSSVRVCTTGDSENHRRHAKIQTEIRRTRCHEQQLARCKNN